MNFRTVDEFEKFNFDEAHISGIEIKSGHVFLYLDNVMIAADNSCNRDIREMRTNDLVLKLQDGVVTSFVKEGVKVYNADGVFQREIPDEISIRRHLTCLQINICLKQRLRGMKLRVKMFMSLR